jgi:hypothetical protein
MDIGALLSLIPVGWRAFWHGKVPPLIHRARPGAHFVQQIFDKLERRK